VNGAPLVSVLMPTYNAAGYVGAAINSILCQTWTSLELIVVDDGSQDATVDMVAAIEDRRIRLVRSGHRGVASALNEALAVAGGELIMRMDADDLAFAERIARLFGHLERNHLDVVGSAFRLIDAQGHLGPLSPVPLADNEIKRALQLQNPLGATALIRRNALARVGGFRESAAAEDYDLWVRLAEVGCRFGNVPEVLYLYRWYHGNSSQRGAEAQKAATHRIRRNLRRNGTIPVNALDGARSVYANVRAYGPLGTAIGVQLSKADLHAAARQLRGRQLRNGTASLVSGLSGLVAATPYKLVGRPKDGVPGRIQNPTGDVTVLLPVYNGEPYLRSAISSILAQSYSEFELLVINDGSTDGSGDVARSFSDRRIRVVDIEHAGLAAALNQGLALSARKFIVRMDADDLSLPDRLAQQLEPLFAGTADVVGSAVGYIDETGARRNVPPVLTKPHHIRKAMYRMCAICAAAFDRQAALSVGGYGNSKYTEDLDLWRRMVAEGYRFQNVGTVLYLYRRHPLSVTVQHELELEAETHHDRQVAPYRPDDAGSIADSAIATLEYWRTQGWQGIGLGRVLVECEAAQARWERQRNRRMAAARAATAAALGRITTAAAWRLAGRPDSGGWSR
jgi:glycosyltransferase involved in cell wall biosynthesis